MELGKHIHGFTLKQQYQPCDSRASLLPINNAFVSVYSECGSISNASMVFQHQDTSSDHRICIQRHNTIFLLYLLLVLMLASSKRRIVFQFNDQRHSRSKHQACWKQQAHAVCDSDYPEPASRYCLARRNSLRKLKTLNITRNSRCSFKNSILESSHPIWFHQLRGVKYFLPDKAIFRTLNDIIWICKLTKHKAE